MDLSKYSRVERYRNSRAAKHYAEHSNGIYLGWVEESTTFEVRGIGATENGCYIVVWE